MRKFILCFFQAVVNIYNIDSGVDIVFSYLKRISAIFNSYSHNSRYF